MSENSSSLCRSPLFYRCCLVFTSLSSVKAVLILYLSTFVLCLGVQRWRRHSFRTWGHAEVFTYHQASMDLLWVLGFFCRVSQDFYGLVAMGSAGMWASLFTFYGEIMFHILTCAERYVAVVHPVSYRGLKDTWGVRIRNISCGCVWLLCLVLISANRTSEPIPLYCILVFSMSATSACSLRVLWALVRPGPGEKERVERSKQRAFCTVAVVSSAQWFWFSGLLVSTALTKSSTLSPGASCLVETSAGLFNLPSSLVLPLLFLHRVGKLLGSRLEALRKPGKTQQKR